MPIGDGHTTGLNARSTGYHLPPPTMPIADGHTTGLNESESGPSNAHHNQYPPPPYIEPLYKNVHMKGDELPSNRGKLAYKSRSASYGTLNSPVSIPPPGTPIPEERIVFRCIYKACGRIAFSRKDHLKEHYRKVHMTEYEHFKAGAGEQGFKPVAATISWANQTTPVQAKSIRGKSTMRNDGLSPSGTHRGSTRSHVQFEDWIASISDKEAVKSSGADEERILEQEDEAVRRITEMNPIEIDTSTKPMSRDQTKDNMAVIKSYVLDKLDAGRADKYYARIGFEWDVVTFMETQYCDDEFPNTALSSIITISGSAQHAQATTCLEYIRQVWPANGSRVLDALQLALDSPIRNSKSRFVTYSDDKITSGLTPSNNVGLEFDLIEGVVCLKVESRTPNFIVDVVQQIAWMGAALQTSATSRVQYCEPILAKPLVSHYHPRIALLIHIAFETRSPSEEDNSCWFPLFRNPVIAHRCPTPHRNNHEVGLEITLDMMAALGGARHAVDFEGGLLLKGYSTLFVPVRRHEDSVQWHLICANGEDRISYREASAHCPRRVLLKDLDHEDLKTKRAYLGLWKDAETHLATADADYKSIEWSKAKEASASPRLTGGTLGISKIVTAQVSFTLGTKDGPFHNSQQGPFQKTIDHAEKLPIVLYDQRDRRAWLVPALPVILHIIQLQHHIKPFVVDGRQVQIISLDPSRKGNAAREALAKNKSQKLYDRESNEEKDYCFRDAVLDNWSILDRLMETEANTQATPGVSMHTTWQTTLYGWEFRAVADEERHFKQKAQVLEKTAGRWYELVKDVNAVVLFASGLGDIIKPGSDSTGLCRKWRRLPKEKDFLAVCVPMLETFYAKAGHRQDHQYLTSAKLQWHRGSMLFEPCTEVTSDRCHCDRVQQVYHDSYKVNGYRKLHGSLEADGCVVFGQAHHPMKPIAKPAANSKFCYSLPNCHINDPAISQSTSMAEHYPPPPSLDHHIGSHRNGTNMTRAPSQDSPPTWGGSNDILLNKIYTTANGRRRLLDSKVAASDESEDLDEAMEKQPSRTQLEYCTQKANGAPLEDTDSRVVEAKCTRRPILTPDHMPLTTSKAKNYRRPSEPCQHLNGCSCKSRFKLNLESRSTSSYSNTID